MLLASIWLSTTATAAASLLGVGPGTLEGLWKQSEIVVLGRVQRVEQIPREVPAGRPRYSNEKWMYEPSVPIAVVEVKHVFRGPEELKSVLVFAQHTGVCDMVRAEPGEFAFFFLERSEHANREGEVFRTAFSAIFGNEEVKEIVRSGRGRLPIRRVGEGDVVDFYSPDLGMPENMTVIDDRAPGDRSYVRSVALTELESMLEAFESFETRPLLAATALSAGSSDLAWDALIAADGWCHLTIHRRPREGEPFPDPRIDRHRILRVPEEQMRNLTDALRREWASELPRYVGSADALAWQREIRQFRRVPDAEGRIVQQEDSVKIGSVDEARMSNMEVRRPTVSALRIWREVRGAFDIPSCVDLRPDDARWIE